jgi:hypothetical protein
MPDSITPPWGLPLFDERDLDVLLSGTAPAGGPPGDGFPLPGPLDDPLAGHGAAVPAALRQVADTLAALRGLASPAELRGESAIRAQFRAAAGGPAAAPPSPVAAPARRHGHRKPARRGPAAAGARWGKLAAAIAVAAAIVAAVYASDLPGRMEQVARVALFTRQSGTPRPTAPGVDIKSARAVRRPAAPAARNSQPEAAASPSATAAPDASGTKLCQAFITALEHPSPLRPWWQTPAYKDVSAAAGGQDRVPGYCAAELASALPHGYPRVPFFPGAGTWTGTGSGGQGAGGTGAGTGNTGAGTGSGASAGQPGTPGAAGQPGGQASGAGQGQQAGGNAQAGDTAQAGPAGQGSAGF